MTAGNVVGMDPTHRTPAPDPTDPPPTRMRARTPEDIAGVVAFLASPAGHWVNGQVLRANGGMA